MISECFNPVCRKKLEYLRAGKVIGVVRQNGPKVETEHFWLCGDCHKLHDLRPTSNGTVVMTPYQLSPSNASSKVVRWLHRAEMSA